MTIATRQNSALVTLDKSDEMPHGYKCAHCGKENTFSEWLFAHWHIPTIHLCECGARSEIRAGIAALKYLPRHD